MAGRIPLPDELRGGSLTREQAARAGLTQGRLRREDVLRPFRGVQATEVATTTLDRCRTSAVRLKPGQSFSHRTAARLHGLTLPSGDEDVELDVAALRPADAPHSRGVRGHRVTQGGDPWVIDGLPIPDPLEVLCRLGAELEFEDLAVIADELMNRSDPDEDVVRRLMLDRIGIIRRIGSAKLVRAVEASRRGAGSPAETRVRLTLDAAGLPEAEPNAPIEEVATGRHLGSPDFVSRAQRVVLEYEGEQHRLDRRRFRYDIVRYDDLAADGWRVLRATGDHLTRPGRVDLVRRVGAALLAAERCTRVAIRAASCAGSRHGSRRGAEGATSWWRRAAR